jgi:FdhD protein
MRRMKGNVGYSDQDLLAAEEPLEIRVEGRSIAVVMRTPGDDCELAAGFLVTEGLVRSAHEILDLQPEIHCRAPGKGNGQPSALFQSSKRPKESASPSTSKREAVASESPANSSPSNIIHVKLKDPRTLDLKKLTRHVFSSSSCGICSKASIEAVRQQFPAIEDDFEVGPQVLLELPAKLATRQETFSRTGGLHACALFDLEGHLLAVREDVGRHNALDKLVGWALLSNRLPLRQHLLLLSGRTSFEMMQKALAAGIPLVAAISAPSSLAVEFAQASGQTLVGFLRGERMNVYASAQRVPQRELPRADFSK